MESKHRRTNAVLIKYDKILFFCYFISLLWFFKAFIAHTIFVFSRSSSTVLANCLCSIDFDFFRCHCLHTIFLTRLFHRNYLLIILAPACIFLICICGFSFYDYLHGLLLLLLFYLSFFFRFGFNYLLLFKLLCRHGHYF